MIPSGDTVRSGDLALQLREYCKLDMLAMVDIHRYLEKVVGRVDQ